jgi:ParB/RepB/Spo0J family partition protein
MTKMVLLEDIRDNPHRDKKRNPIDTDKVKSLVESIGTTGFWKGIYGRVAGEHVEIAFGHNRVDAARAAGLKSIPVEIEKLTDADMLMRMTRENLRGELVVALEAVSAAVKAYGAGMVEFEEVSKDAPKSSLRYAPSFVPGKEPCTPEVQRPYNTDTLARVLGAVYVKPSGRAQNTVLAALGILEMEERKVKGFSEEILHVKSGSGPDGKYVGAKRIIEIVSEVKQREVKAQERAEKSAEEIRLADEAKRKAQQETKEREAKEKKEHDELIRKQVEALAEENDKAAKRIQKEIKDKAVAAEAKAEADKAKLKALDENLEAKKEAAQEQRKVDEYLPIRRETDRIIHILERRDLEEDLKALSRRPLSLKDRERVWQSIDNLSAWLSSWAAAQFIRTPQLSKTKQRGGRK